MPDISYANTPEIETPVVVKTAGTYTLLPQEMKILADATSGNVVLNPPTNPLQNGRLYAVTKIDNSSNTVTWNASVNDNTNFVLRTQYRALQIVPNPNDQTKWIQVGNN
jgi:hypothetical protein